MVFPCISTVLFLCSTFLDMKVVLSYFCVILGLGVTEASKRCVWARGKVECKSNPDEVLRMEIRMYDRDGGKTFGWLDSDDLMG